MEGYIRFDRFIDLETSLEQLLAQIQGEPMTATCWKWSLIAAHSALQGAVCIALRGSAGFDTWKPSHLKKWLAAYENSEDLPDPQLGFFMELFDRLFGKKSGINRDLISWLNESRNKFIHFNTDQLSIERKSIISAIDESVTAIIEATTRSQGNFFYGEQQPQRLELLCHSIRARLRILADA
ncbi:hypothetical protein N8H72_15600 [Pseudomonas koreensis]|uniref:hypothetical protein n=1 Tax=Pseudomonas koreensis TaxID=198620 RepID=UPI0021C7AE96|nr:hypothetical protein [Pseudomonas koreensis]MCU0091396.1 hypothetical protein [Pseudomonas koreensis]